jgi:hypothetical protein
MPVVLAGADIEFGTLQFHHVRILSLWLSAAGASLKAS